LIGILSKTRHDQFSATSAEPRQKSPREWSRRMKRKRNGRANVTMVFPSVMHALLAPEMTVEASRAMMAMEPLSMAQDRDARAGKGGHRIAGLSLPRSRPLRILAGVLLVLMGLAGFLPVLGFWMLPLGLMVLSVDLPAVRRLRRRASIAWMRWRRG
jgi:hypothetical protein